MIHSIGIRLWLSVFDQVASSVYSKTVDLPSDPVLCVTEEDLYGHDEEVRSGFIRAWDPEGEIGPEMFSEWYFSTCLDRLVGLRRLLEQELSQAYQQRLLSRQRLPEDDEPEQEVEKRRMSRTEANEKAMELAKADPNFAKNPSPTRWAKEIGCSVGTVYNLSFFQVCQVRSGQGRGRGSPNVVGFTDKLESTTGEGNKHEVLDRLIAEQDADSEPSPLEDDPPDAPQRVRHRKRL